MTTQPRPGTLAFHRTKPALITAILDLLLDGSSRSTVVATMTARKPDRMELEAAHTYWVQHMSDLGWEDRSGTPVLMILEDILREIPRAA